MSTESRPSEADTWLPHMLDPTPSELLDLFEFCRGLAEALRRYERYVAGQSLETVCLQRAINPVADAWRHLLDALERLGSWGIGDAPLAFDESPDFFVDIAGWTDPDALEAHFPIVQAIYTGIVSRLIENDLIGERPALVECAMRWVSSKDEQAAFAWYTREPFEIIADDMARSPGQGGTVASTMLRESAANIIANPEYNIERVRDIGSDWRKCGGVCHEAVLISEDRKQLTFQGVLPSNLPEHYTHWDRIVRPGETFPSLAFPVVEEDDDPADALEIAADMMESVFDEFCEQVVPDGTGRRLRIDPQELPRYRGYSKLETGESTYPEIVYHRDPFTRTREIESLTGTRLRDGLNPLWFLNLYEEYKHIVAREGPLASFAEYATRSFHACVVGGASLAGTSAAAGSGIRSAWPRTGARHADPRRSVRAPSNSRSDGVSHAAEPHQLISADRLADFESTLASVATGRLHAGKYESLVGGVIKHCFPEVLKNVEPHCPIYERHVIRDWVAANCAETGFWRMIRGKWKATQVLWECKNKKHLKASDFHQIAYYLNRRFGRFAIITFRGDLRGSYLPHLQKISIDNNAVVLLLNDQDLASMVSKALAGRSAESILQLHYDRMLRNIS